VTAVGGVGLGCGQVTGVSVAVMVASAWDVDREAATRFSSAKHATEKGNVRPLPTAALSLE
jgi:hypothetical protein